MSVNQATNQTTAFNINSQDHERPSSPRFQEAAEQFYRKFMNAQTNDIAHQGRAGGLVAPNPGPRWNHTYDINVGKNTSYGEYGMWKANSDDRLVVGPTTHANPKHQYSSGLSIIPTAKVPSGPLPTTPLHCQVTWNGAQVHASSAVAPAIFHFLQEAPDKLLPTLPSRYTNY
jgi:hypothetical protein